MGPLPQLARQPPTESGSLIATLYLWRAVSLVATAFLGGLLLTLAPGLDTIDEVVIPVGSPPLTMPAWALFQVIMLALALPATVLRWARFGLYGAIPAAIAWALAGGSRFPWWFLNTTEPPESVKPDPGVVLLAVFTLVGLLFFLIFDALNQYLKSARARGVPDAATATDLRRIATTYLGFALAAAVFGILLYFLFEEAIAGADFGRLSGDAWGAWVLVLVGLLVVGFLLVLGRGVWSPKQAEQTTTWKDVK